MLFHEISHFLQVFAKSSSKARNVIVCSKSCKFLPNRRFFMLFHEMSNFFSFFFQKVDQNLETWQFAQKVKCFRQIHDFTCFLTIWATFCNFLPKSSSKRQNVIVFSKSWVFWGNLGFFMLFHEMKHFFNFFPKSSSKPRNLIVCLKTWEVLPNRWFLILFHEMSHFLQLFSKKLIRTWKRDSLLERLQVLAISTIFHAFSPNEPLFGTVFREVRENFEMW